MPAAARLALAIAASARWARASDDPCQCLNWIEVYESQRVLCGEGYEFFFYDKDEATYETAWWSPFVRGFEYEAVCSTFFHRMDNNYCVNRRHHTYDEKPPDSSQWCYVSKECTGLNGGRAIADQEAIPEIPFLGIVPPLYYSARWLHRKLWPEAVIRRDVAMKHCRSGPGDTLLGEMPIGKIVELAQKMNSVTGFVTKLAYPLAKAKDESSPIWEDIKDAVAKGSAELLPPIVAKAVRESRPIIVDKHHSGEGSQIILVGKEVYKLSNRCEPGRCGALYWQFQKGRDVREL